jgi:MFS superfamily sulfate permease-like transporter
MNPQNESLPVADPPSLAFLRRRAPGLVTLLNYRRAWFVNDLIAGLVLTAILVPVGMGYAEASGVPAINGLYATIIPLIAYALFGPSRIMVLGPDSTLAAVIAALILPLANGSATHAVALAGMLALLSGACSLLIGFARLGLIADLLSKPIRIGFLNAIALTVLI